MTWLLLLAVALAQQTQSENPHSAALGFYGKHAYGDAAASFRKALETETPGSPQFAESTLLLGQSLYFTNHMVEAISYLEKAPRSNEVLYMLGSAYLVTRDLKKSEASFAGLFGLNPDSAAAHLLAGHMMVRQGMEEDAAAELKRALALDPKLPQVHYLLGEISMYRGAADEAIGYLQQEVAINPDGAMAYYKLGDAYTRKSNWGEAIAALQRSIWLNPDFSGPYILLGKAYSKTGHLPDAESALRHAVRIDPQNYSAHYLLGQVLIQSGKADEGRQLLQKSQELKH